ncbi:hypothetical protein DMB42_30965 [Nonomuraea sp. WAC 01424]|uniref:Clp protease N-terminal domain-containing protein n=1 Tax=Nonomuraea sp. WAC 01424 TaxID=2203200 RepID=UPI000F77D081|nr:Clp protease N-terminal domain-containing protein [Nonomuraea sp. WAC 01424]RSN04116.1 hypothetical protein DMB42_30965 [Nonomuraea sp. WAC 01424]
MFDRFTQGAREAVVRAGFLALDAHRATLDADLLLLGVAEVRPFTLPSFTASGADLRPRLDLGDARSLLATLGIDLDEVRRRTRAGTDAPELWSLRRSRLRPLRVTLDGPLGRIPLAMHARKVIEVAMWKPGPVTGERLLWGLLADGANGAGRLLAEAGVDVVALVREAGIPVRHAA